MVTKALAPRMEMEERLSRSIFEQSWWDLAILLDVLGEEGASWVLGLSSWLMGGVTNWQRMSSFYTKVRM